MNEQMNFFKRIFHRKRERDVRPLRIEGVKTSLTKTPDEQELAAQALLESLGSDKRKVKAASKREQNGARTSSAEREQARPQGKSDQPAKGTPEYYRTLSTKIRESRAAEARLTMRYLAYCEEQLALPKELYVGQIAEMEVELYKRQTIAEREGGELLRRWQHCLAEVIVRQMSAVSGTLSIDPDEDIATTTD